MKDESRLRVRVASTADEVDEALSTNAIEAVIVPRVSIPTWWAIDPRLARPLTVPRLVAVVHDPGWSDEYVDRLAFDGLLLIDFEGSSSDVIDDIERLVAMARTRGSRSPRSVDVLDDHPDLATVTGGDPVNERILSLMAIGRADIDIARAVFLSPNTVRNRISGMLQRGRRRNRTELVLLYLHRSAAPDIPLPDPHNSHTLKR